jgi:hypothetical protein
MHFTFVMFSIVFMLSGCDEKEKQLEVRDIDPMRGETYFIEGAISKIMTKMYWDGEIAGRIRTRRSLATEILKDHSELMSYYISKRTGQLKDKLGKDFQLYTIEQDGSRKQWTKEFDEFWTKIYDGRMEDFEANNIKLEIVTNRVLLNDVENPMSTLDCRSEEIFDIRVIDTSGRNSMILLEVRGGIKRCHSEDCPWVVCEF